MNPKGWGTLAWIWLFVLALYIDECVDSTKKTLWIQYCVDLIHQLAILFLPCEKCRLSFALYIKNKPPEELLSLKKTCFEYFYRVRIVVELKKLYFALQAEKSEEIRYQLFCGWLKKHRSLDAYKQQYKAIQRPQIEMALFWHMVIFELNRKKPEKTEAMCLWIKTSLGRLLQIVSPKWGNTFITQTKENYTYDNIRLSLYSSFPLRKVPINQQSILLIEKQFYTFIQT